MSDSLEHVKHKVQGISKLESVVKTMKILAAANISMYEQAIIALEAYTKTIELSLSLYFKNEMNPMNVEPQNHHRTSITYLIVFGTDQGLVGQFNEVILNFTANYLSASSNQVKIWVIGERIYSRLEEINAPLIEQYDVPNSVDAITELVGQILVDCESYVPNDTIHHLYVIHNQLLSSRNYKPVLRQVLPLDQDWQKEIADQHWPTNKLPEILGDKTVTLSALIREHIFITLYRACAQSLASENASRLASMQRAEKNIEELIDQMDHSVQLIRQKNIDEEIFDVISGSQDLLKD